jgi:protein-S-isoprenylcysteine O-methyltransferase Ste14
MKKILPPTIFLICLTIMLALHLVWPVQMILPPVLKLPGLVLFVAGMLLTITGSRHFTQVGTNVDTFGEPGLLVKDGAFRYSRNPMYLGMSLSLLGVWLFLGSLSPLAGALVFICLSDRWYIPFEEKKMVEKFGQDYLNYKLKTRRWF